MARLAQVLRLGKRRLAQDDKLELRSTGQDDKQEGVELRSTGQPRAAVPTFLSFDNELF
jgi:hypothetical protein